MNFQVKDFLYPIGIIKLKALLKKTEFYSYDQLVNYQNNKLKYLVDYSYNNIPYYRELFDKNNIMPGQIKNIGNLSLIPILTKDIVRKEFDKLICDEKLFKKNKPSIYKTSGSTGTPLQFYHDRSTNVSKFVFMWRMWEWAGYRIGKSWAVMGNFVLKGNNLFKRNRLSNALYISIRSMNKNNASKILEELIRLKCETFRGYPSGIVHFLHLIENKDLSELSLKGVITTAEMLSDYQRNFIKDILGVKVFNMYSQWEHICLAMECEYGNMHHQMENGVLEILDRENRQVKDGELGEITATGFYNKVMPLIRYKTGDLAIKRKSKCKCGRQHDIIESLDGRTEDMVITPDGRHICGLNNAFKHSKGINLAQIVQKEKREIIVKIVRNKDFSGEQLNKLEKNLRYWLGDEMKINFLFVSNIKPSSNGKVRFIINNIIEK